MAPIKPKSRSSSKSKPSSSPKSKEKSGGKAKPFKQRATAAKVPQVKTKRPGELTKKKKRVYTAEELGVPKLNGIVPAGVQKPKGKKKGKVFVDDAAQMMTILKMVEAEKQGQIESKLMRERQLEEVREARRQEIEARQEHKKAKLEETKDSLRKRRKRKSDNTAFDSLKDDADAETNGSKGRRQTKRVSFG